MEKELLEQGNDLLFLNKGMNDITEIIKSIKDSGVLTDEVTETVKHGQKKEEGGFLGAMLPSLASSIMWPVISLVVKGISGRKLRTTGRGCIHKKNLVSFHPLSKVEITKYLNNEPRFNGILSRNNLYRIRNGAYVINCYDKKK